MLHVRGLASNPARVWGFGLASIKTDKDRERGDGERGRKMKKKNRHGAEGWRRDLSRQKGNRNTP